MAWSVNFHLDLPEAEEGQQALDFSPHDENIVHDSFNELIEEQSNNQDGSEVCEMEDMAGRGRENPAFLASPQHSRSSRENFSPDTLRVLSAMPSRTIGRNRGAIISQYYNRTMKLRHRRSRPSIWTLSRSARPSISGKKELLSELARASRHQTLLQRLAKMTVHLLAWVMSLGSTVACAMGVYHFSTYMHKDLTMRVSRNETLIHMEASLLALPVVVSTVNLLMSGLFNAVTWMEQYDAPSTQAYVAICRNLLLKMSVLGVLCYHWLGTTISGHVTLSKRVKQNGSTDDSRK
ncbi:UNVERIFIED_CONTAM: hypothetical protein FKN15_020872 [Acipenser sinensis]